MIEQGESLVMPEAITNLKDGTFYFNFNVDVVERENINGNKEKVYKFNYIHIIGNQSYTLCVRSLIRAFISESEEFDIINSYNRYNLGLTEDKINLDNYIEYLHKVENIKEIVKQVFNN